MHWFEPLFVRILRHEYAASMRFDTGLATSPPPAPPASPCQLYVHVPFCEVLCPFCSFHRVRHQPGKAARYFDALRQELRLYHERGFRFADVYVGGGTPTVVPHELAETLALMRTLWSIETISVETNPDHLREDVLRMLSDAGVTRLSVGVQSFDDGLLRAMERYDKYGSGAAIRERLAATQGRFRTLNVDMIYNLPNQTEAMLDRDLEILAALGVDQISFYPLMTSKTAEHKMAKTMGRADPRLRYPFFQRILQAMRSGYEASSAWCFSRVGGMIDEYIIDEDDYIGVGSGAFSFVGESMYSTTFSINQYCARIDRGLTGITQSKQLSTKERMRYDFLVRLFGLEMTREYVNRKYGRSFWLRMGPELATMRILGATRHDRDAIRLTPLGMYLWVLMMAEFFNTVNAFRDDMRLRIREELESWDREEVKVPLDILTRGGRGR